MNKLLDALEEDTNITYTQNGALSNKSTFNDVLNFFASGSILRNSSPEYTLDLFKKAYSEDNLLSLKCLFYTRDVRGGQGERKTFRLILNWLGNNYPEIIRSNLDNICNFGRYDDLFCLVETQSGNIVFSYLEKQLYSDIDNFKHNKKISLLAKWMPSINTSSSKTRLLAKKLCKELGWSYKYYRKMLSQLRKHIDVVEKKLCNKEYSEIKYENVPSRAAMIYRKCFSKKDSERYSKYLNDVQLGVKKINSSVLYPYDIVRNVFNKNTEDKTLDLQWNALPNYLEGNDRNVLVVCDVSGSMMSSMNKNVRPLHVSISLAMYFAERNNGIWKNTFITFSENPELQKIKGDTIYQKVNSLQNSTWGYNTNLEGVFDCILNAAVKKSLTNDDMPKEILIISDMEFDEGLNDGFTNHKNIISKYKSYNYDVPKIIYWNVNSINKQYPVTVNDYNTCIISGCSPVILKSIFNKEKVSITPLDVMMNTLNADRYSIIKI
jgi:hypothetical protein